MARRNSGWPELGVRRWGDVLEMRTSSSYDYAYDGDSYAASDESRRIHELRGLVMSQVAEIEDLLYELANTYLPALKKMTPKQSLGLKKAPAGELLVAVELCSLLNLEVTNSERLDILADTIQRRNALVHATVQIGFSWTGSGDRREPVIALLSSRIEAVGQSDIGEYELEPTYRDLTQRWTPRLMFGRLLWAV